MTAHELAFLIPYVLHAHANSPTKPEKAVRLWDKKTPYGIHPVWCAMTLLTETKLPESLRTVGAQVLLLHDVLEDTTAGLPHGTSEEVARLVDEMTFSGIDEEMELIWAKSPVARLLKVYDKVSNLLDGDWMSHEKRARYAVYLGHLCNDVEDHYGMLNITRIARAIV